MARSQIEVPGAALLVLGGGVGWLLASTVLPTGVGTVVLAAELALTVWLFGLVRQRTLYRTPAHPETRRRVLRLVVAGIALVALEGVLLGLTPYGELGLPVAAATVGALMLPMASLLRTRSFVAAGAGLMVLGAAGALLALNTVGAAAPQGLVGVGAALLLWGTAAHQAGLLDEVRGRIGMR
jgi:hypothetical protein